MLRVAHIVNPFTADPSSDLFRAQPVTFNSMINAKSRAKGIVEVDLLSAQFIEDIALVPAEFKCTANLSRSVLDVGDFEKKIKLPFLADILEQLYNSSNADYLIYTNVDIALYPEFYIKVKEFIERGHDAFIINRLRIDDKFITETNLDVLFKESGKKHPGFDCFVFHRDLYPKFKLAQVCIGVPFIEISFSQNLFALSNNFNLFDDERLTFHIGMEIFRKRAPREYFWYNRKQFHKVEAELFSEMSLKKFPYYQLNPVSRFFKWVFHPCIPIRLVLKLALKK